MVGVEVSNLTKTS
jgi:Spy/CpxP family protein refolding chaperone